MATTSTTEGRVYLVGAGPGDPGLLTMEAARLLKIADVVFHDDLVSPEILALIPEHVYVESVGKRCGHARANQRQIHSLMINAAREGWTVVRLKSGDPLIFGRAGEEMEALGQAGIEYVVVPGVTAAFAAAAQAGIPLTDRRLASKLLFLSNHQCEGKPLSGGSGALSADTTTLVYMTGADYGTLAARLCQEGLALDAPCLLVSRASTAEQAVHAATLSTLAATAPPHAAPAVLVVGAVAARYTRKRCRGFEALLFDLNLDEAAEPVPGD